MKVKYVFGHEFDPRLVVDTSTKNCLMKIKEFYIDREKSIISEELKNIEEIKEFGIDESNASSLQASYRIIEECRETISEIESCKSMAALQKLDYLEDGFIIKKVDILA